MAHIISMRSECEKKAHRDGYNITVSTITAHIEKKKAVAEMRAGEICH